MPYSYTPKAALDQRKKMGIKTPKRVFIGPTEAQIAAFERAKRKAKIEKVKREREWLNETKRLRKLDEQIKDFVAVEQACDRRILAVLAWMYEHDDKWPNDLAIYIEIVSKVSKYAKAERTKRVAFERGFIDDRGLPIKDNIDPKLHEKLSGSV